MSDHGTPPTMQSRFTFALLAALGATCHMLGNASSFAGLLEMDLSIKLIYPFQSTRSLTVLRERAGRGSASQYMI